MLHLGNLESVLTNLEPSARNGLMSFLKNVVRGQPDDWTTPFLPTNAEDRQSEYAQEIKDRYALTSFNELNDIEAREAEKFGPFSVRDPWTLRRDSLAEYFVQRSDVDESILSKAVLKVTQLNETKLRPLPLDLAFAHMPPDTNLGLPSFTSDARYRKGYLDRSRALAAGQYQDTGIYPAVIGWRGQPNGSMVHIKNRNIFMMDHLEVIVGLSVQVVSLYALRDREEFCAWNSLDIVDKTMTNVLNTTNGRYIISVDFSGFDRSVPPILIHAAFDVLRNWFVENAWAQLDWLERTFRTVGIVTPDGLWQGRNGGVPSGSALTNLIDSLCQLILWNYVSDIIGNKIDFLTVLGDDGVIMFRDEADMDLITDVVESHFGMMVGTDKGGISKDSVKYLQRLHMLSYQPDGLCRGVRSFVRTWNGCCHLERRTSGLVPQFFSARAVSQFENCRWHPNFPQQVKLLYQSDKFLRQFDPLTVFKQAGGAENVEAVLHLRSFKVGLELPSQGLNNFETVRILRSLRRTA